MGISTSSRVNGVRLFDVILFDSGVPTCTQLEVRLAMECFVVSAQRVVPPLLLYANPVNDVVYICLVIALAVRFPFSRLTALQGVPLSLEWAKTDL